MAINPPYQYTPENLWIDYTNHRGERRWRNICGLGSPFLATNENQYHVVGTPLVRAWDNEKKAFRYFALNSVHAWRATKPDDFQQFGTPGEEH